MSFPQTSIPLTLGLQSTLSPSTSVSVPVNSLRHADERLNHTPPSTVPSIMDNKINPRTRLVLVLSSLSINLLLPFINGVMLGFGEIFAKEVVVGWFGWKTRRANVASAGLGLYR